VRSALRPNVRIVGAFALLVASGCSPTISGEAAGEPPFPECKADAYAFVGRTSLQALGLADLWPEESGSAAEIWITEGPVAIEPDPAGGGAAPPVPQRMICVQMADGSGMARPIADDWVLPSALGELAASDEGATPIGIVGLAIGVVVVAGVSVLAFRHGSR
jgi:hypothetical protein